MNANTFRILDIHRDVEFGQCKGALLRIQIKTTAYFIFPNLIRDIKGRCWAGTCVGILSPKKTVDGYVNRGFYFSPWLAPDIAVGRLPGWYTKSMQFLSFKF